MSKNLMNKQRILFLGCRGMVGHNLFDPPEVNRFDLLAPKSKEGNLTHYSALKELIYLAFNYIINFSFNFHCA